MTIINNIYIYIYIPEVVFDCLHKLIFCKFVRVFYESKIKIRVQSIPVRKGTKMKLISSGCLRFYFLHSTLMAFGVVIQCHTKT